MNKLTPLFWLVIFTNLQAQITFESNVIINETYGTEGPIQVFAADMDGDGDKDILAVSFLDGQVTLYDNVNGNLSNEIIIPSNINSGGIAGILRDADLADLDGDGDLDIITSRKGNFNAYWIRNMGGGNFQLSSYPYNITGTIERVKAADMDNDGDMDIIAARDTKTYWYRNTDGLGTFEFADDFSSIDDINVMHIADIDGDNYPDLIYASEAGTNLTIIKNTNGSFSATELNSSFVNRADGVTAADVDTDGDIDLVITSSQDGTVGIARNNDGNFTSVELLNSSLAEAHSPVVGDVNFDNRLDIVISTTCGEGLFAFYGNGSTFSEASYLTDSKGCNTKIYIDDIEGDGDIDLMSCSIFDNRVSLYYTENATIGREQHISSFADRPNKVALADLDDDGDLDVVSSSSDDGKIAWFTNLDGKGRFGNLRIITDNMNGARDVLVDDINGDGRLDVLAASRNDDKVTWFQNLGGANFFSADKVITNECDGASRVKVGDLNDDGIMDVLYGCEFDNTLIWKAGIFGVTDFGTENILSNTIVQIKAIDLADVDGDGDLDVIAAGRDSPSVSTSSVHWFENMGAGNFSDMITIGGSSILPKEIHMLDYEGDGDLDILLTGLDMRWYVNEDGQGGSWSDFIPVFPLGVRNIYPHDMDNDGDTDIIMTVTDEINPHIIWEFDNGTYTPTSTFVDPDPIDPIFYAAAGDIDLDGDQDIVTCGYYGNGTDMDDHVKWMDNRTIVTNTTSLNLANAKAILYPNPTNESIFIKSDQLIVSIEIIDLSGKLIQTNFNNDSMDCSTLNSGMYFCKITFDNDTQQVLKFIKQ